MEIDLEVDCLLCIDTARSRACRLLGSKDKSQDWQLSSTRSGEVIQANEENGERNAWFCFSGDSLFLAFLVWAFGDDF